jgi:hypothetical protein
MGMGPIIWTCLALTIHQGPVQEYFMPDRGFKIPIKIDPKRASELEELFLLVSQDKGGTWQQVDRKSPNEREFIYHAPEDGHYWFIVQQIDRNHRTMPASPSRAKPNMAVIVDTTRPQVKVTAERLPNGEIRARWTANDQYPDVRSLRMDYHTSAHPEGEWTPLGITPSLEGKHEFPVREGLTGDIRIRVRMKDQAGNEGEDMAVVAATAASFAGGPSGSGEGPPISLIPPARSDSTSQPNQLTSQQSPRPALESPPGQGAVIAPPPIAAPSVPAPAPAPFSGMPIAANVERTNLSGNGPAEAPANSPAVKIVKAREVRLDFTVGKVGPSGLGNADIYVTLDKGAHWKKMPGEVPISLAQGTDLHGTESVSGSVSVQLPAEGTIYGFIVAVKSKAGLAPPPPKDGDAPEALVELDTTAPKGQLFRPQPDPSQPNTLLLVWEAKDRNLADKPITLEWAEQKDGPWNPIGEGALPNTSQFPWRLPDRLPPRVYLRLTMRDLAGNEARAQTDKPELIDLSVPQTRITGVAPASR